METELLILSILFVGIGILGLILTDDVCQITGQNRKEWLESQRGNND